MGASASRAAGSIVSGDMRPIRLLIVDDSAVARAVFTRMIAARREFDIAATVSSADAALAFLSGAWVDIIILDIEMPGIDGLTALPDLLAASNGARVLIVSSSADEGAAATMRALTLGAADTLAKPGAGSFGGRFADILAEKLIRIGHARNQQRVVPGPAESGGDGQVEMRPLSSGPIACIAIGASTGGLHALSEFLCALPEEFDAPILITQHLPPVFMSFFAAQIEEISGRTTRVAHEGAPLMSGEIMVAPGEGHLGVEMVRGAPLARVIKGRVESGCMPSVDPMFETVAAAFGEQAVGVILSGMGRDGTIGARAMVDAGSDVLLQNRETSVVWGMPGAAAMAGMGCAILPPAQLAELIARRARIAAQ
jgi:two-component system chemotaxis response regulator CheB